MKKALIDTLLKELTLDIKVLEENELELRGKIIRGQGRIDGILYAMRKFGMLSDINKKVDKKW